MNLLVVVTGIIIGAIGFAIEIVMCSLGAWAIPWRGKGWAGATRT